jgi:hypothetical protein
MTNGMKSGAGSDPFADDDEDASKNEEKNAQEANVTAEGEIESETDDNSTHDSLEESESVNRSDSEDLPYIFRRNGVKDDRKMVQYFLRDDTEDLETEVKRAVEQDLDTDVYLTDLREALVRVGAEHVDEVANELREWGYRYRE